MKSRIEHLLIAAVFIGAMLLIVKFVYLHQQTQPLHSVQKHTIANPASVNCNEKGGTLQMKTRGDGGEYGVCVFEDNMQCEEWALFRGDCPVGGISVAGFDNQAQVYCAISGGQTLAVENATCTFPNGTECSAEAYYNGTCGPNITSSPAV